MKITGLEINLMKMANSLESQNLNLTQLSQLEPYANLDLNNDGVIGNIIYKKFASDYHHGANNHIEQLKTYELMSGGYVLSKNDYPLNSNIRDIETDHHGKGNWTWTSS